MIPSVDGKLKSVLTLVKWKSPFKLNQQKEDSEMVGNASGLLDHDRLGTTSPILSGFARENGGEKERVRSREKVEVRAKGF